jgi:hypothetical protein
LATSNSSLKNRHEAHPGSFDMVAHCAFGGDRIPVFDSSNDEGVFVVCVAGCACMEIQAEEMDMDVQACKRFMT